MENHQGIVRLVLILVVVLIVGYWLSNSQSGAVVKREINNADSALSKAVSNSTAGVYPAAYYPANYYANTNTLYPANANTYTNTYSGAQYSQAYVTIPIAKSTAYSQPTNYYYPQPIPANYYSNAGYYNYAMPSSYNTYMPAYEPLQQPIVYPAAYQYQQYQYQAPCNCSGNAASSYYYGY